MGSSLYEFCSTECPFLVIAILNVVDGVMRLCLVAPNAKKKTDEKSGFAYAKQLLSDLDILTALGQLVVLLSYNNESKFLAWHYEYGCCNK